MSIIKCVKSSVYVILQYRTKTLPFKSGLLEEEKSICDVVARVVETVEVVGTRTRKNSIVDMKIIFNCFF